MSGCGSQPRRQLDAWQEWAKQRGARGLAYILIGDDGELGGPGAKNLSDAVASGDVAVGKGAWTAVHHAFTMPKAECLDGLEDAPGDALAYAYDIVCNGNEIGGGSIRIHRRDIQERVFKIMGIQDDDTQGEFGFLLEAFAFGAPPHGGIAFGWDRVCALLAGTPSIRDVIAFPKSGGGFDPLTSAPAPIPAEQRAETGMDFEPEDDEDESDD